MPQDSANCAFGHPFGARNFDPFVAAGDPGQDGARNFDHKVCFCNSQGLVSLVLVGGIGWRPLLLGWRPSLVSLWFLFHQSEVAMFSATLPAHVEALARKASGRRVWSKEKRTVQTERGMFHQSK